MHHTHSKYHSMYSIYVHKSQICAAAWVLFATTGYIVSIVVSLILVDDALLRLLVAKHGL